jgi:23S rRNA pseudouridine2605 synthase
MKESGKPKKTGIKKSGDSLPFQKFRPKKELPKPLMEAAARALKSRFHSEKAEELPSRKRIDTAHNEVKKDAQPYFEKPSTENEGARLNKYMAHSGVASRRKADELIKEGKVRVNGLVVTEMGYKLQPNDVVEFAGKKLNPEKKFYILLNKPKDYITTVSDERDRKTVMDLIKAAYAKMRSFETPRMYPVGRLDRNTTGVLLITNDGDLSQKLTHPSSEIRKIYHVFLDKKLRDDHREKIASQGVMLEDGLAVVDEIAFPNPKTKSEVGVEIHSGKNRIVRRIFESLGYEVEKLDRVFFAGLTKKDLPRGKWRFLTEEEVRGLKYFQKETKEEKKKPARLKKPIVRKKP